MLIKILDIDINFDFIQIIIILDCLQLKSLATALGQIPQFFNAFM